ncbi:MAG: type II toxin-antitoxin system VapC family toxin [Propionibacteriaceae bacterium]|jgi:predicted nucleic-acid-binding protein|nr:type II toxin-antitoxin system VapC family toxin [Propionibacteriaceae bacterium]
MRLTPDTNVLVLFVTGDDSGQAAVARRVLTEAESLVITVPTLCELVWVLRSVYQVSPPEVARAVRALVAPSNVVVDRAAVAAGLALADVGGDFADGAIAALGRSLGADEFVTFDRRAAKLLSAAGVPARLLGGRAEGARTLQ